LANWPVGSCLAARFQTRLTGNLIAKAAGRFRPIGDIRCPELVAPKRPVAYAP